MHPKHGTPVNALLFLGGLTTIAPFFGLAMLDWAVDATGPAVVITFLMVSITFVILRRREPSMDRPLRVGGRKLGMAVGVVAVISTAVMLALYLPGLPAFLTLEPWIIFLAWWTLGIIFALRLPGGIKEVPMRSAYSWRHWTSVRPNAAADRRRGVSGVLSQSGHGRDRCLQRELEPFAGRSAVSVTERISA